MMMHASSCSRKCSQLGVSAWRLQVFNGGKAGEAATREALVLFEAAMQLLPSRPEARAALYNAGCCHVKLKQWQAAVECVEEAVNEQGLKLNVALEVQRLLYHAFTSS